MASLSNRERVITIISLAASLGWQVHVLYLARSQAPLFVSLFEGLGVPLPTVTRFFLATYPHWWVVTTLLATLSLDVLRRHEPHIAYVSAVLGASVAAALGFDAWLHQALAAPMLDVLQRIG